jgi:LysR family transcriptional regulator for metE and metH
MLAEMMLEVRHLRVVEAISKEGGVSKAARRLHLTQPAVSHTLRSLERQLGARLFQRSSGGMVPTAAGARLLRAAAVVLDELEQAEQELVRERSGGAVLRLATQCYNCYHWLPGVLKLYKRDFPALEVQIVPEAARRPVAALLAGEIDLAIVTSASRQPELVTEALFTDEMVAIMPPGHRLANRHHLEAEDFRGQHLVAHPGAAGGYLFTRLLTPAGVSPQRLSELPLTEAVIETVKAGLGISVMPRWAVAPELAAATLRAVRLTADGLRPTWYAALRSESATSKPFQELVYHLRCCALAPAS